jgi:hypothetical protein
MLGYEKIFSVKAYFREWENFYIMLSLTCGD